MELMSQLDHDAHWLCRRFCARRPGPPGGCGRQDQTKDLLARVRAAPGTVGAMGERLPQCRQ
jgi:hypothetical protein